MVTWQVQITTLQARVFTFPTLLAYFQTHQKYGIT
jgi:hypothetical protein